MYGSKELANGGMAFAGVYEAVAALPNGTQRTVTVIEGADHLYTGLGNQLAARIASWLAPGPEIVMFLVILSPSLVSVMAPVTAKLILSPLFAFASA